MSERGNLSMKNIAMVVAKVTDHWYSLGVNLNIPEHKLNEIKINNIHIGVRQCMYTLIDVWLRTDLTASWAKLAKALEEMEDSVTAAQIKEEHLGIPGSSPIPTPAFSAPRTGGGYLGRQQQQPMMTSPFSPMQPGHTLLSGAMANTSPAGGANHHGNGGFIATDGPAHQLSQTVPISAQAPITNLPEAKQLLTTTQERLMSGLTHSKLDVNFTAEDGTRMTLLHHAVMQGIKIECVKALIAFGAEVNPLNSHGLTPLDLAKMCNPGGEIVGVLERIGGVEGRTLTRGCQPVERDLAQVHVDTTHILCLPTSGPYCLVQLQAIQQIETQLECHITKLFQWIVAGGFGALFLLLLIYGNKQLSEVKRLYYKLREEVFNQTDMARRSQTLDGFLQAHLGTQMTMSDIKQPRVLIGALYKGSTKVETHFFNNYLHDDNFSNTPVWKVARYTCSLPLNIMECDNYLATSHAHPLPSLALQKIRTFYTKSDEDPGIVKSLVCIEAGQSDARELGCIDVPSSVLSSSSSWFTSQGAIERLTNLLTLLHSSSLDSASESLKSCRELCELHNIAFHHFNPLLRRPVPLSFDVPLEDLVEAAIDTISQIVGKPLHDLCTDINNL